MAVRDDHLLFGLKAKVVKELVKDPVCGIEVDPENAYYTEIGGMKHYFCGPGCKASFKKAYFKTTNKMPPKAGNGPRENRKSCH